MKFDTKYNVLQNALYDVPCKIAAILSSPPSITKTHWDIIALFILDVLMEILVKSGHATLWDFFRYNPQLSAAKSP